MFSIIDCPLVSLSCHWGFFAIILSINRLMNIQTEISHSEIERPNEYG